MLRGDACGPVPEEPGTGAGRAARCRWMLDRCGNMRATVGVWCGIVGCVRHFIERQQRTAPIGDDNRLFKQNAC